ncbi:MAG: DEAD/DEAH box helicase [Opitutaceae bacterium]|nr:DEAD/DEAH box helicase [Opitutaceae bacterium]
MEKRKFAELGLAPELLKAVDKMGFEEASPIQTAVIPLVLAGRDLVGQSSTGSGKTCAFAIPAVQMADPASKKTQVLILCPTRELAVQVAEEVSKLTLFKKGVRELPVFGGQSYDRQLRGLAAGVQIVIGTPGRVLDHIDRGTLKLDNLKMLILDEADRMLDMGFRDDIERVIQSAPAERQVLFFSATMPPPIRALIKRYSKDPALVKIDAVAQNAPQVEQVYFEVERHSKVEALTRLIDVHDFRYGIIFCSTKVMVDELDEQLHARGYAVDRLHGDMAQMQRDRVMAKFRDRKFEFLIATDVAARGLDVDDLEIVFNFDLPNDAEDYTHRIGRTGRAGKSGRAFTFVCGREIYKIQFMINSARLKIRRERIPSMDQVEEARDNVFFEKLRSTLNAAEFKKQDRMIDRLLDQDYSPTDIAAALIHLLRNAEPAAPGAGPAPAKPAFVPTKPAFVPGKPVFLPTKPAAAAEAPARAETPARTFPIDAPVRGLEPVSHPFPNRKTPVARPVEIATPRGGWVQRTGNEAGFTPLALNVGKLAGVTPADIVGKIAGVTRLSAKSLGAIDLLDNESYVDVANEDVEIVLNKLPGIMMRGTRLLVRRVARPGE